MTLEITPVQGSKDLEAFIRLPDSLYRDDKTYVPMMIRRRTSGPNPAPRVVR